MGSAQLVKVGKFVKHFQLDEETESIAGGAAVAEGSKHGISNIRGCRVAEI
jgi:hypothetical protein